MENINPGGNSPLDLEGLHNIRLVTWGNLRPGMVVLHGFSLNGSPLPELSGYPVLTRAMVEQLYTRYKLLRNRQVVVADVLPGFRPGDVSGGIREKRERIVQLNTLRNEFAEEKMRLSPLETPLIDSDLIDRDTLIKDSYNSFSYLYGSATPVPSLFDHLDLAISLGDLLTNRLTNKFSLPHDRDVMLHLVVDCSLSMESADKLGIALSALQLFQDFLAKVMKNTRIRLYRFSDECRPVESAQALFRAKGGETNYSSFMKKVLHLRDREMPNKVILFTDGRPSDRTETMKMAALIKKNKIDYTQLIFDVREELRHEVLIDGEYDRSAVVDSIIRDEDMTGNMTSRTLDNHQLDIKMAECFKDFTDIAEAAGGNQVIFRINEAIKLVSVECYDRYMGLLSLEGEN